MLDISGLIDAGTFEIEDASNIDKSNQTFGLRCVEWIQPANEKVC